MPGLRFRKSKLSGLEQKTTKLRSRKQCKIWELANSLRSNSCPLTFFITVAHARTRAKKRGGRVPNKNKDAGMRSLARHGVVCMRNVGTVEQLSKNKEVVKQGKLPQSLHLQCADITGRFCSRLNIPQSQGESPTRFCSGSFSGCTSGKGVSCKAGRLCNFFHLLLPTLHILSCRFCPFSGLEGALLL